MIKNKYILLLVFIFVALPIYKSQFTFNKENKKYSVSYNNKALSLNIYDTVIGSNSKICMACLKKPMPSANKFIRTLIPTFVCNYFNSTGQKLVIKYNGKDTTSMFALSKSAKEDLLNHLNLFKVYFNKKKYLVDSEFNQITFNEYDGIALSELKDYYIIEKRVTGTSVFGLIDKNENSIIEPIYANIKINLYDSTVVACVAGLIGSSADDLYNLKGVKLNSFNRHIEFIDKYFSVYKIYQPHEYFIVHNNFNKKEIQLSAEAIKSFDSTHVLIAENEKWYKFNLKTKEKNTYKQ
jgi:hypothetical protein